MWDAWEQIKSAYPTSTVNWEPKPPDIWVYAVHDLTPEQLANGVRNLVYHVTEFPPNAGQFRDLCLTNFSWERQCHKTIDTSHLIENITGREKRCAEGLEKIRQLRAECGL